MYFPTDFWLAMHSKSQQNISFHMNTMIALPCMHILHMNMHMHKLKNTHFQRIHQFLSRLFDSITIEYGTLKPMCAEGASLPFRGADAEMKRPGDHYTFGPIVSDARPRKRRNESTPTCQHTGKGKPVSYTHLRAHETDS